MTLIVFAILCSGGVAGESEQSPDIDAIRNKITPAYEIWKQFEELKSGTGNSLLTERTRKRAEEKGKDATERAEKERKEADAMAIDKQKSVVEYLIWLWHTKPGYLILGVLLLPFCIAILLRWGVVKRKYQPCCDPPPVSSPVSSPKPKTNENDTAKSGGKERKEPIYPPEPPTEYSSLPQQPSKSCNPSFRMEIEDVFYIEGRGVVATGRIEYGVIKVGDEVEIIGFSGEKRKIVCTGVEMFNKTLNQAKAGDNVGLLLRGVKRDEIQRGQVVVKPS